MESWLNPRDLKIDLRLQVRQDPNPQLSLFEDLMRSNEWDMTREPLPEVVTDGKTTWLVHGFTRTQAAVNAGIELIKYSVTEGDFHTARLLSCRTNQNNGDAAPLTLRDKRRAAEIFFEECDRLPFDHEYRKWSDYKISAFLQNLEKVDNKDSYRRLIHAVRKERDCRIEAKKYLPNSVVELKADSGETILATVAKFEEDSQCLAVVPFGESELIRISPYLVTASEEVQPILKPEEVEQIIQWEYPTPEELGLGVDARFYIPSAIECLEYFAEKLSSEDLERIKKLFDSRE